MSTRFAEARGPIRGYYIANVHISEYAYKRVYVRIGAKLLDLSYPAESTVSRYTRKITKHNV